MNDYESGAYLQFLILIPFLVIACLFLWFQQKTLTLVRSENRRMPPGQVWLQLIPLFGLVWQFIVVGKISDSIRDELNTPSGDSLFSEDPIPTDSRPTYATGVTYSVLACITIVPLDLVKGIASLAMIIMWIIYWVELSRYTKRLKQRTF